jgi:peptidoglycan/xylan/chitin deacetylase (PgdA/CDA1 family)
MVIMVKKAKWKISLCLLFFTMLIGFTNLWLSTAQTIPPELKPVAATEKFSTSTAPPTTMPRDTTTRRPATTQASATMVSTTTMPLPTEPTLPPEPAKPDRRKLVCITFDDGPHQKYTPELLNFLSTEEVHATFFVLGCWAKQRPEILRRMAAEGHQVASHTVNHKNLTKLSAKEMQKEINDNADLIERITGKRPTALRPPYGAYNAAVQAVAETPLLLWNVDPKDWKVRDEDIVYRRVADRVSNGSIILLHDWYPSTVAAAKRIVRTLKARGYTFVTVDEMLAARGSAAPGEVVCDRLLRD